MKFYYQENAERIRAKQGLFPSQQPEYIRQYYHTRLKHRESHKVCSALRSMLKKFICQVGDLEKRGGTCDALGYSARKFKMRIECQFQPGMSWSNHGEWHIDHKIPMSHFISKGETRPHIVNALSNLQPLWAGENMAKGNRWIG